jgi:hypothetical protein
MEQWIKTVLAQEQAKINASSIAAAEVGARVSEGYISALGAYRQAIFEDERRRFLRSAAEIKIEVFRTQEASRRAEERGYKLTKQRLNVLRTHRSPAVGF